MKPFFTSFLLLLSWLGFTQEQQQDTIKTAVVKVVTSYTPKVTDAFKIRTKPVISLKDKNQKKQLTYSIFSAPVASTFVPKSGTVKGIDVGKKERLYSNFLGIGYGNNNTFYSEGSLYKNVRFKHQYGASFFYNGSDGNIPTTVLNSSTNNFNLNAFYVQNQRYLDWKISATSKRRKINWYGLPTNINFDDALLVTINPEQNYNAFAISGEVIFKDFILEKVDAQLSFFNDSFNSSENKITLNGTGFLSLKKLLNKDVDNIKIEGELELLKGKFAQGYGDINQQDYNFFTLRLATNYLLFWKKLEAIIGAKFALSFEANNSATHFLVYPDVNLIHPIFGNGVKLFLGASGGLQTNSFETLVAQNPFISPTQSITQTNNKYTAYGGFLGKIGKAASYRLKVSYANEEDKVLFIKNNSISNGNIQLANTIPLQGFEYGNSFTAFYDDVNTFSFFGEIETTVSRKINFGVNATYNNYETKIQQFAYNLPEITSTLFAKIKSNDWFANIDIFYVGDRKDVSYAGTFPSLQNGTIQLSSFVDANLEGGYHLDRQITIFVKLNNLGGQNYERFSNFNVQGFQALAGLTWKFDF